MRTEPKDPYRKSSKIYVVHMLYIFFISGRGNATQSFIRIDDRKTWSEARRYCRDYYTDLVNVRNQTENQRILNSTGGGVWIGLYRNRVWSNGQITKYEDWRPAIPYSEQQPDNGVYAYRQRDLQHCTAVSFSHLGRWTDELCLSSMPFICYNSEFILLTLSLTIVQTNETNKQTKTVMLIYIT